MNWIFASLPLLLLIIALWVSLGLAIIRVVAKVNDGITASALSLPIGLLAHLFLVNTLSYVIFLPITVWLVLLISLPLSLYLLSRKTLPALEWKISQRERLGLLILVIIVFISFFYINAREMWGDDSFHTGWTNLLAHGQFPLKLPYLYMAEISGGLSLERVNYDIDILHDTDFSVNLMAEKPLDTSEGYTFRLTDIDKDKQTTIDALLDTDTYQVEGQNIPLDQDREYLFSWVLPSGSEVVLAERIKQAEDNFGDKIQMSKYILMQQDGQIVIQIVAEPLKNLSSQYHYSLILTNEETGERFQQDGSPTDVTQTWEIGQNYLITENRFPSIPYGIYRLSMAWYDYFSEDYKRLQINATEDNEATIFNSIVLGQN